jgi:hypothetical protein
MMSSFEDVRHVPCDVFSLSPSTWQLLILSSRDQLRTSAPAP